MVRAAAFLNDWVGTSRRLGYFAEQNNPFKAVLQFMWDYSTDDFSDVRPGDPKFEEEFLSRASDKMRDKRSLINVGWDSQDPYLAIAYVLQMSALANPPDAFNRMLASPEGKLLRKLQPRAYRMAFRFSKTRGKPTDLLNQIAKSFDPNGKLGGNAPNVEKWLVLDTVRALSTVNVPGDILVEMGVRGGKPLSAEEEARARLREWARAAEIFTQLLRAHVDHFEFSLPNGPWPAAFSALQERIWRDCLTATSSTAEKIQTAVTLSQFYPRSGLARAKLQDVIDDIEAIKDTEQRFHWTIDILTRAKAANLPLDVKAVDRLLGFVKEKVTQECLAESDSSARLGKLKDRVTELKAAFKDSPYYYVIDQKIDKVAETIAASREESELLAEAKTFRSDIIQSLNIHTEDATKKANNILNLLEAIVNTMRHRPMKENERVRRFIIHGADGEEGRTLQYRVVKDIMEQLHFSAQKVRELIGEQNFVKVSKNSQADRAAVDRVRLEAALMTEMAQLHERFSGLPPEAQILLGSFLLTTPSQDGFLADDPNFFAKSVDEFFLTKEGPQDRGHLHILSEEFLRAFDSYSRSLLITKAEIQNRQEVNIPSSKGVEAIRARRTVQLLSGLGPMGIKVAQLLARWPQLSPIMRAHLQEMEDRAEVPSYDQLYKLLSPHLTTDESRDLVHIFGVRAGSIKVTVFVKFRDPSGRIYQKVYSIKRPNIGRIVQRIHDRMKVGLVRAFERSGDSFFRPFLTIPDEAKDMVESEMDFQAEMERIRDAATAYREANEKVNASTPVDVVTPERLSNVSPAEQAIVAEYIEGLRIDQIPDLSKRRLLLEEVFKREMALLIADGKVRIDSDRHPGNFIIVEDASSPTGYRIRHIDFGQWISISSAHRDFFTNLIAGLTEDYKQGNRNFEQTRKFLESTSNIESLVDTPWWEDLRDQLQKEIPRQSDLRADRILANLHGQVIAGLLHIRVAVEGRNKSLGSSMFRLTKVLETLNGVAQRLEQPEFMHTALKDQIIRKVGVAKAIRLALNPTLPALAKKVFVRPARVSINPNECFRILQEIGATSPNGTETASP